MFPFWLLVFTLESFGLHDTLPPIAAHAHNPRAVAEFERTDAVFIAWDESIAATLGHIVSAIPTQTLIFIVISHEVRLHEIAETFREIGVKCDNIRYIRENVDTPWIRDFGPILIETDPGTYAFVDTRYWASRLLDDEIPQALATRFNVPLVRSALALDGGNFLSNGNGFCIMTTNILDENPELTEDELADAMNRCFGCDTLVILEPLDGEETGHVDIFAKFIDGETLLVGAYSRQTDPVNADILDRNVALLLEAADAANQPLRIERVPMGFHKDGYFRTYLNALLVNDVLIVPVYPNDTARELEHQALEVYRRTVQPWVQVKTVDATDLTNLGGAVHCLTLALNVVTRPIAGENLIERRRTFKLANSAASISHYL